MGVMLALLPLQCFAQGTNDGMGGSDRDFESLYQKVTQLEKRHDALQIYLNFAESYQMEHDSRGGEWTSRFYNKNLRLEMKGYLTDHLYYRFRHRLNKSNAAKGEDNFAKATDYMMVGWKFNDQWSIQGGKKCQAIGGFEFDENPMFIYQYSDMEDHMDSSKGAINVLYHPSPTQELSAEVSNTYNGTLEDEWSEGARMTSNGKDVEVIEGANHPLTYIVGWNGKFFDNKLLTRWSFSYRTQAKHKYSRLIKLGQQLNLPRLQWYFDYNGSFDGLDRMKIASTELAEFLPENTFLSDVHYHSFVTKMNWLFAPAWNLMLKGMYETASVSKIEQLKSYRKALGYIGSLEYYPAQKQKQDLRIFLAYVGRKYDYSEKCGLADYHTDRIELGIMYRLKAY